MRWSKLKSVLLMILLAIFIAPLAGCHYTDGGYSRRSYYYYYDDAPRYYGRYRDRGYYRPDYYRYRDRGSYHYHPDYYHYHRG